MDTNDKIIANKTIKGFSINFGKFYFEGQKVDFSDKRGNVFNNALIKSINENANTITVIYKKRTFIQKISSLKLLSDAQADNSFPIDIQTVSGKSEDAVYMVKTINGFSIDLYNWYYEGQKVLIITENDEILNNATIKSVNSIVDIMVDIPGTNTFKINLEDIKQIQLLDNDRQEQSKMLTYNCS